MNIYSNDTLPHSYAPGDFSDRRRRLEQYAVEGTSWGQDHLVIMPAPLTFQ